MALISLSFGNNLALLILCTVSFHAVLGWRPRRTMIFMSWGAEEFGNLGSYEWVEVRHSALLEICISDIYLQYMLI